MAVTEERAQAARPGRGAAVSAGVMALLVPVHGFLVAAVVLAAGRYDSSGQGGPFRSCTADSVSCDGPNHAMIAVAAAVLAGIAWAVAGLGVRAGRYPRRRRARAWLTALNVVVAVVAAAAFWLLQRG
ncbi:hypothetical protein [Jiangella alba]|uniref:Uncharacterized protein n=1 Tax=Jiangella alba TaxID=561176 RepID=A0A1H5PXS5_9ACTN|nr:hypothetical protein [Jiangella alba]SEF18434.1 hypothetical protein SAMN04488561_6495 [Jiangella alba]